MGLVAAKPSVLDAPSSKNSSVLSAVLKRSVQPQEPVAAKAYHWAFLMPVGVDAFFSTPKVYSSRRVRGSIGLIVATLLQAKRTLLVLWVCSGPTTILLANPKASLGVKFRPHKPDGEPLLSRGASQPVTIPIVPVSVLRNG